MICADWSGEYTHMWICVLAAPWQGSMICMGAPPKVEGLRLVEIYDGTRSSEESMSSPVMAQLLHRLHRLREGETASDKIGGEIISCTK